MSKEGGERKRQERVDLLELDPSFNAAAIHPLLSSMLGAQGQEYFKRCKIYRDLIVRYLQKWFHSDHSLFLAGNTSAGLIAVYLGILMSGWRLPRVLNPPFPLYDKLVSGRSVDADDVLQFCTHINPVTGEIFCLKKWAQWTLIVDAAQSIGTCFQGEVLDSAAIFVAPLHKHLGIAAGLGIVGVNFGRIPGELGESIQEVLKITSEGAMSLHGLAASVSQLKRNGPAVNKARIHVGRKLKTAARRLDLSVVTPMGVQAHMVCFTGRNGRPVEEVVDYRRLGAKLFKEENVLRLSFHSDVHGALSPAEYEKLAIAIIERGLKH